MSVTRSDLTAFPRPVQDVLLEASSTDGIEIKMLDGRHARVLNGDREVRPIKVSGSRPAEHTLRRLEPWLDRYAEGWREENRRVNTSVGTALEEAVRRKKEEITVEADSVEEPSGFVPDPSEWLPYVSPSGKDFGFDTDGKQYRCRKCGFLKSRVQGMHLHEAKHTGAASKWASTAGKRSKRTKPKPTRAEPKKVTISEGDALVALRDLADHFGMQLVPKGEDTEALRKELDEAKARLALMREAMEA